MPKFRKKPVVINAIKAKGPVTVETLEGPMTSKEDCWIITGIKGERYICEHDIFLKTYSPVDKEAEKYLENESQG